MKKYIIILAGLFLFVFYGCKKAFLDEEIKQNFDEELFLKSGFSNLKAFGMGTYNFLPMLNDYGGNALLAAASDEADYARPNNIQRFNTGAWSPFNNPDNAYGEYYRGIRHANLFLEKTADFRNLIVEDTVTNSGRSIYIINVDDFTKLRAEVRFLRAYFYMELAKRYGGVPIVTTVLDENSARLLTRNSFDECIDFIASECDAVYPALTNHYTNYGIPSGSTVGTGDAPGSSDVTRLGRIEKPAALALKLRALLFAASPLHNPNQLSAKYERAVAAAIQIFNDPNCASVRFISGNYKNLFQPQNTTANLTPRKGSNSGIIMTRPLYQTGNGFERANYPAGAANGGKGVTAPSQNLVDAYEMRTNGLPITDANSGYDPQRPYLNRDPRLEFTVVVNGSVMGREINNTDRITKSFDGGVDGIGQSFGATTTGYYLRKFSVENFDLSRTDGRPKAWVLMRYAEVLLNFAEAANEAFGPDVAPTVNGLSTTMTARDAVNMIRARAGVNMPPIPAGLGKLAMQARIRNERRVELAFEEFRFFDVRRWKIAAQTETQPLRGMRVTQTTPGVFNFQVFNVENRIFDATQDKMYLYPIPFQEIAKSNGALVQNPGW